jgi:hypothetical protein
MIKLIDILFENQDYNNIETFNKATSIFPNLSKQIKRDKPKITFGYPVKSSYLKNGLRLDLNKISGIKYDMGGEDLEDIYSPDKNIFEINYSDNNFDPSERNKELKELGFGGYIEADLSKFQTFSKANGINITNTVGYFPNQATTVAKTIDNSLNSGGLLFIWDHYGNIEKMINVLPSYKILEIHPVNLDEFDDSFKDNYNEYGQFDGDDVGILLKK